MDTIPPIFQLFTLLPIIFFLVYTLIFLGFVIFAIIMVVRFVKAHERIADQLESVSESIRAVGNSKEG